EVRITEAPGGVDVQPLDGEIESIVRRLLGAEFDLDSFYAFAATEPILAGLTIELRGLRPPIAVEPFESLVTSITAQQVSLRPARVSPPAPCPRPAPGWSGARGPAPGTRPRPGPGTGGRGGSGRASPRSASPAARPSTRPAWRAATSTWRR